MELIKAITYSIGMEKDPLMVDHQVKGHNVMTNFITMI